MPAAPQKVLDLVDIFDRNSDDYLRGDFNEANLRQQFVNPLFKCLGWDMDNEHGYAEAYKDVIHEATVQVGEETKAPDYCFRISQTPKFFVEAKKPAVNIKTDPKPAFQLRRYGWSKKLPLSILTDFEEFAVYDCRFKPALYDKASDARILYLRYDEYAKRWDEIADVFSREAILKGSFDKYAESNKGKRGTTPVDAAFLNEIEEWRVELAKNLALRNRNLTPRELNFAVQMTIDRIIFLRLCEDRGIEPYGQLQNLMDHAGIYDELCKVFHKADQRYNSGLFHFEKETDRPESPDALSLSLQIDDKVLKSIFKSLYYPCPYVFKEIPADILGHVYEQFLGKVIRLTTSHQARIEEKPEVKKAGGVYYTPTYIVDYIVKHTVGKLLGEPGALATGENAGDAQTPVAYAPGSPTLTPKQARKLRILDPACGSGSFLLGAYDYLLKWYLARYVADGPEKHKKELVQIGTNEWKLTTSERKEILLKNIYGVDIDPQAVEVTKLSLLLKVLEGESQESLERQLVLFHGERALPDLASNIKCGNSLIGPDFYEGQQPMLFDDEEKYRINVFDWHAAFPDVMKAGGFDAVIGNPPYVRIQTMQEWAPKEVEFYKKRYTAASEGNYDIYVVFVEKAIQILRGHGQLGFILPHKFFNAQYGAPLRQILANGRYLSQIVNFGDEQVFDGATTYTCLMFLDRAGSSEFRVFKVEDLAAWRNEGRADNAMLKASKASEGEWNFAVGKNSAVLEKLESLPTRLGDIAKLFVGLQTDADSVFILQISEFDENRVRCHSAATGQEHWFETEHLKPFLKGSLNIRRYHLADVNKLLIFPYEMKNGKSVLMDARDYRERYPLTWSYLEQNRTVLAARNKGEMGNKWYGYVYKKNHTRFTTPKLLVPSIALGSCFAPDLDGLYYFVGSGGGGGGGYGIVLNEGVGVSDHYLLGLLNSKLLSTYLRSISTPYRGGYIALNRQYIEKLPIRIVDAKGDEGKILHDNIGGLASQMLTLHKQLAAAKTPHERTVLDAQITAADRHIDRLVYELYGLTDDEIKIVEEGTA